MKFKKISKKFDKCSQHMTEIEKWAYILHLTHLVIDNLTPLILTILNQPVSTAKIAKSSSASIALPNTQATFSKKEQFQVFP